MSKAPRHADPVDAAWQAMVSLVMDSRNDWRKTVTDATGLPFSRLRVLRRLTAAPMTIKDLAEASSMDAPATTVALNALEAQGLVARQPHPDNRRAKLVQLTPAGRRMVDIAHNATDGTPPALRTLSASDLATLGRILGKLTAMP